MWHWSLRRTAVLLGLAAGALALTACAAQEGKAVSNAESELPALAEPTVPAPPMQGVPWEAPPTELSDAAVSVATVLFEQGMADPRRCEYREVDVIHGGLWGAGRLQTHGWTLPVEAGGSQRFAVLWNGWVYPVAAVGEPASIEADVEQTLKTHAERRAEHEREHPGFRFPSFPSAGEGYYSMRKGFVSVPLSGVSVCLLLRSGHVELAERTYAVLEVPDPPVGKAQNDPYLAWATAWLWSNFSRTVSSLGRGDDYLALVAIREISRAHPLVEAEATRRGFERRPYSDSRRQDELQPHVTFLGQVPELLKDLERRAKRGERPVIITDGPAELRAPPEQVAKLGQRTIAELIDELENVRGRKWGEPGGITWEGDPTIAALVERGEAAVPALLDCWEKDDRLTRTASYSRSFHRSRTIVPVSTVAQVILRGILKVRFKDLGEARAYWKKNRDVAEEDRWYATLLDDTAGKEQWLQAAMRIVQPTDVAVSVSGWRTVPNRRPEDVPTIRGEPLREKSAPTVLELLGRRASDVSSQGRPGSERTWAMRDACSLVLAAASWDAEGAKPLLAEQHHQALQLIEEVRGQGWSSIDEQLGPSLQRLPSLACSRAMQMRRSRTTLDFCAALIRRRSLSIGMSILRRSGGFPTCRAVRLLPRNCSLRQIRDGTPACSNSAKGAEFATWSRAR